MTFDKRRRLPIAVDLAGDSRRGLARDDGTSRRARHWTRGGSRARTRRFSSARSPMLLAAGLVLAVTVPYHEWDAFAFSELSRAIEAGRYELR